MKDQGFDQQPRRKRMERDNRAMVRVRRRYIRAFRVWLCADKERVYEMADRMIELGLYSKLYASGARFSIISYLAEMDGCRFDRDTWNRWLIKEGWHAYWGYWGTKEYRAKQVRMATRRNA